MAGKRASRSEPFPWRRAQHAAALGLVLLVLAAFAPAFGNGFVNWDDMIFIVPEHPQPWTARVLGRGTIVGQPAAFYPVFHLSLALDNALWGKEPTGYHAMSVAIHAAAALLILSIGSTLMMPAFGGRRGPAFLAALFAAAVFAVHPVNVEPVAWASGRKMVLTMLFCLLSFYACTRAEASRAWRAAAPVLFLLGCLSNILAVPLAGIVIAWEILCRGARPLRAVRTKAGFLLVAVLVVVSRLGAAGTAVSAGEPYIRHAATLQRLTAPAVAMWEELRALVFPVLFTGFYPPRVDVAFAWGVAAVAGLVALGLGLFLALRRCRTALFFLVWAGLALGPTVMHHLPRADRHLYLPSVGLSLLAGWALVTLALRLGKRTSTLAVVAGVVVVSLAALTHAQCRTWRNGTTLWGWNVRVAPDSWMGNKNLADQYVLSNRLGDALEHFQRVPQWEETEPNWHWDVGRTLAAMGENDEAEEHLLKALELRPNYPRARDVLAVVYEQTGRAKEAWEQRIRAARNSAYDADQSYRAGLTFFQQEYYDEALYHFGRAVEQRPAYAEAWMALGNVHLKRGRFADAAAALRSGLQHARGDVNLTTRLAWLLATAPDEKVRNAAQAVSLAERARRATGGDNGWVMDVYGAALAESGRFREASEAARAALEMTRHEYTWLQPGIRDRLRLYAARRPWRLTRPKP